jgi:hypothetical protein
MHCPDCRLPGPYHAVLGKTEIVGDGIRGFELKHDAEAFFAGLAIVPPGMVPPHLEIGKPAFLPYLVTA